MGRSTPELQLVLLAYVVSLTSKYLSVFTFVSNFVHDCMIIGFCPVCVCIIVVCTSNVIRIECSRMFWPRGSFTFIVLLTSCFL